MSKKRCAWCIGDPVYEAYHDNEWGYPIFNDSLMFEFLTLETFQAGLSWITILRKRRNFKIAFDNFDYHKIASYDIQKKEQLLDNPGIIRNRLKISASIINAKAFIRIQDTNGSFANYIWNFVSGEPIINKFKHLTEVPEFTPLAEQISKDLKQKGFKFVGPRIIYAFMQATGIVNDHLVDCFRHPKFNLKR